MQLQFKTMFEDTYRHKGLRKNLIEQLRHGNSFKKGITNENVLLAMEKVPRHLFLDPAFVEFAYQDKAFQIGCGQTISQPYTVAFQTQLLEVKQYEKILEIGTGSGYQACVLCELGAKVFSIERQKQLFDKVSKFLPQIGYSPKLFYGDGYKGLPTFAPFDKIIITCGAPIIPEKLLQQLNVGGIMVIPFGDGKEQEMQRIIKQSDGSFIVEKHGIFSFVPMLENRTK